MINNNNNIAERRNTYSMRADRTALFMYGDTHQEQRDLAIPRTSHHITYTNQQIEEKYGPPIVVHFFF